MFLMKSNTENITSLKVCTMKFSWKFSSCTSWEWDSIRSVVTWGWASAIENVPKTITNAIKIPKITKVEDVEPEGVIGLWNGVSKEDLFTIPLGWKIN